MSAQAAKPVVLVVDDDPAVGKVLEGILCQADYDAAWVSSGEEALAALNQRFVELVISDLKMPGMDGMALLGKVKHSWPDVPVVMISAHATVAIAVEGIKQGAADFIQKPFDRDEILFVVRKELLKRAPPAAAAPASAGAAGSSAAMRACDEALTRAARSSATVLLRGETGVGKEVAAHAIHDRSKRSKGPFVAVHATALPQELLESELFGHEKGAFTGAVQKKAGRVELAEGGTLFLDELGDIPRPVQTKLLRLIQEREYERVGSPQTHKADVRFVAATHRNLEAMIAAGEFREDLFHRLNVVPIQIPPLRERGEDIRLLALQFCREQAAANERPDVVLAEDALALLERQPWPGNVRELQNFIERLVVMSDSPRLDAAVALRQLAQASPASPPPAAAGLAPPSLDGTRREAEKSAILEALRRAGNNRTKAARLLGISRRTLYNKLEELGLDAKQ